MAHSSRAVFLSYASQDATAAQGIAAALRTAGMEVWFDQNELRGGDAWDAHIRQQIRECALFVPVISASTQARAEGYFRLEWKLAVDRSHLMADDAPFLLPVVIDDTPEAMARVPDRFRERQWLRVPGGAAGPAFVERVGRLLTGQAVVPPQRDPTPAAGARRPLPRLWWVVTGVLAVAVAGLWFVLHSRRPETGAPGVAENSIAVLPFANMSEDKDNAFFADGVHEDILTNLALVGGLQVISRTSVMGYRDTTKTIQQIARELHVTYVLEGSVRRIGKSVRVTGQLIDARTDQHLWAKAYDRELSDIFAIQAALAKEIAAALHVALTPTEHARIESRPTTNTTAYDLYLKAREIEHSGGTFLDTLARAEPLLESAVELDPKFALAWAELTFVHLRTWGNADQTDERLAKAKGALDRAVQLAPDQIEVLLASKAYRDWTQGGKGSDVFLRRLIELYPQHPDTAVALAQTTRYPEAQWRDGLGNYLRALALDPRNPMILDWIAEIYLVHRHFDEAAKYTAEANALQPQSIRFAYNLAKISFWSHGSTEAMDALVAGVSADARRSDPETISVLAEWACDRGDAAGIVRLWQESGPNWRFGFWTRRFDLLMVAMAYTAQGEPERARPLLEKNVAQLTAQLGGQPGNGSWWADLALTQAMLGQADAAEQARQKALQFAPWDFVIRLSRVWGGQKDEALADLEHQMQQPPFYPLLSNVFEVRRNLFLWPLQDDPRLKALVDDPKNNTPVK